jgi:LmbE family N-acetylglucosaminyl deacetylase
MEENMASEPLHIMVIGAHPDDCEFLAGGVTALYSRLGHTVRLVSLTNGDAGHLETSGAQLATRRRGEAAAAARMLGAESLVLDHHDGVLMPTLEVRNEVIRIIREFRPDLVMTHRTNDYHPDHRYTGVVVQDACYMVMVSNLLPYVPPLSYNPVVVYLHDHFTKPYPFIPDVVVSIDEVYEQKITALDCHVSQMYEFLFGKVDLAPGDRIPWLKKQLGDRFASLGKMYRDQIIQTYGKKRGEKIHYIEAFEVCEYGGKMTMGERMRLFPFLT